jgi:hypothetical protein
MLSYNWMINQPLHLANIDFSVVEISFVGSFLGVAQKVSQIVGLGAVNGWLGCGLLMKPHPPFIAPQ